MEERHLSLSDVARHMGRSERTVRRWIKAGKLTAYKPGRDYMIPESAVQEFVKGSEVYPKGLEPPLPFEPETSDVERRRRLAHAAGEAPGWIEETLIPWAKTQGWEWFLLSPQSAGRKTFAEQADTLEGEVSRVLRVADDVRRERIAVFDTLTRERNQDGPLFGQKPQGWRTADEALARLGERSANIEGLRRELSRFYTALEISLLTYVQDLEGGAGREEARPHAVQLMGAA